jgi:hypothetical protein
MLVPVFHGVIAAAVQHRRTRMQHDCEICGDAVTRIEKATKCGHLVYLCETCKTVCSHALRYCVRCEDKGK